MTVADEKYVALTTYKKDGSSSSVPVWIADLGDGRLGFTTGSTTLKARRLAHDNRVELQPSNARGVVTSGSTAASGTAEVVTSGAEQVRAEEAIKDKYGYQVILAKAYYKVVGLFSRGPSQSSDAAVLITLD